MVCTQTGGPLWAPGSSTPMVLWEEKYIYSANNPFRDSIITYFHYIDDLIFIVNRGTATVEFLNDLNNSPLNLRFTLKQLIILTLLCLALVRQGLLQ